MSYRDDFKKVLSHQEVHPLPYSVKFTIESKALMKSKYGENFDPVLDTGSYVVASHTNNGWEEVEPGYFKDYFGVIWNKTQDKTLGVVDNPPLKSASFEGFEFPDPQNIPVYGFIEADQKKYPDHFHMLSIGFSLFERAWSLVGMADLLTYFFTDPNFVKDLMEKITEYNIAVIKRGAEMGVDCIHLGDDWGSQHGPLISPDMWREFIAPTFSKTCQVAKDAGLLVSLHCCGNVEEIMPDIVEAGVDVFDPFQPEAMDVWKLRDNFKDKISFWGGLSVQELMPFGTAEEVKAETIKLLSEMAPGGGYILSPAHSLTGDIPLENIEAFLDVARNQERYLVKI